MTEQEIAELEEAYKKAILNGTANTQAWADRMADAKVGIEGYTAALRASKAALKDSMLGLGKSLADGETGAAVFNKGISASADRLDLFFIGKLGPAGAVLGGITKAAAAYVGAVSKQADSLYKSFQEVSRTGTIGRNAMRDVYDNMQKFGYGVKELDKFGSLMSENSEALAKFGGNAVNGAKAFANVATELQHSPVTEQLLNMGISVDEINKGAAGFIKQQTALGRNQRDIGDKLQSSTIAYIGELETISRLTGQTRQQQEQKIADANAEQAFNATMSSLKRKADMGDLDAQKQYEKFDKANRMLEGETRKAFIKGVGGDIGALGPLINVAGGELVEAMQDPSKDIGDVIGSLTRGFKSLNDAGGEQLAMVNSYNDAFGNYAEQQALYSQYGEKNVLEEIAKAEVNKKTTDAATKNMTATQIAERNARNNIQDFINLGINPVTDVMEILAKAIEFLTDLLPGAGKAREQYEMEKKTAATKTARVSMENEAGERVLVTPETAEKIKANKEKGITEGTKSDVATASTPATPGTPSPREALANKIMSAESGGRNIANQSGKDGAATSSAFGLFQFTKGTFEGLAKNAKEGSALFGKTFDDYKKDTGLQREAMNVLMEQNAAKLSSKGLGTSDANMYLAHFLGAGGAAKALMAGPDAPLTDVMSREQLAANPTLKSLKTVADLQAWAEKKMGGATAIPSGPGGGYQSTVTAGTEGQSRAALSTPKVAEAKKEQTSDESNVLMAAQVDKMSDIIRVMEKQTAITGKILQRSTG